MIYKDIHKILTQSIKPGKSTWCGKNYKLYQRENKLKSKANTKLKNKL